MTEHARPRFFSSSFRNLARNHIADSTKAKFTAFDVALNLLAVFWSRAFSDDNERAEPASGFAFLYRVRDFSVIKRDLRNQDNIRAARATPINRDHSPLA